MRSIVFVAALFGVVACVAALSIGSKAQRPGVRDIWSNCGASE
jgi:hypothetical protein